MLTRKMFVLVLAFMFLLNVVLPFAVYAQEVPTVEGFQTATFEAQPTAVPTATPVPVVNTSEFFGSVFTLLAIITAVFVGGTLSLVAILEFLRRKDVRDTSERLYLSASPETQKLIRDGLMLADEYRKTAENVIDRLFDFAKDITDGQPNAQSAAAIQQLRADLNATNVKVAANAENIAQAASAQNVG